MVSLSLCRWEKCIQKNICDRYNREKEINNQIMRFENLCSENNDWKWFYGDRCKMIKVVLIEEKEVIHNEEKEKNDD
jgi:hypothetical protein